MKAILQKHILFRWYWRIAHENGIPLEQRKCTYQGECSGTCPFCEAELHYLEKGGAGDFFNLGNAIGTSVLEVIASVKRVTGRSFRVTLADRRAGDPAKLVGSSEKAQKILGWKPMFGDIDTIVEHAWKWHENAEF